MKKYHSKCKYFEKRTKRYKDKARDHEEQAKKCRKKADKYDKYADRDSRMAMSLKLYTLVLMELALQELHNRDGVTVGGQAPGDTARGLSAVRGP